MPGLRQERACVRSKRAQHRHALTPPGMEGEGLTLPATVGHPWSGCAGGGSTAFSGDRAPRARRKAVDAPEARDPRAGGASAPLPKHQPSFVSWRARARAWWRAVTGPVVDDTGRPEPGPGP